MRQSDRDPPGPSDLSPDPGDTERPQVEMDATPGGAANRDEADRRAPAAAIEFGGVLTRLREKRGYSKKQLASLLGRSPSTISRIEASDRGVSRQLVDDLARVLSTSTAEHHELLLAAGFLTDDAAALLDEPDLTRLSRLLSQPGIRPRDRRILLQYVDLALEHAAALGYVVPPPWPTDVDRS